MKIIFEEDRSFLELLPSDDNSKLTVVMCGRKSFREVTMSSADLTIGQAEEIANFLANWIKNNQKNV